MNNKNTVPIVFHGGGYGTYLEWCLTLMTTDRELQSPFGSNGNSHKFVGHHLLDMSGWRRYTESKDHWNFVRLHPKTKQTHSIKHHLNELSQQVNFFVYLYLDQSNWLLILNNQFDKIWKDWWKHSFQSGVINIEKIYNNWPVDNNTSIDNIPIWIKREFLSHWMMPAWLDQIEWYRPDHYRQPNCVFVPVSQLFYNFEDTVGQILDRSKLILTKSIAELKPYHDQMISLQQNINQDQLCKNIVESVINDIALDWKGQQLTLVSEAYVQWELRNQGFEIRCDGLDTFPTHSLQLKELLYTV